MFTMNGLILVGKKDSSRRPIGFGDYPDGCYPVLGKAVIVVGRQKPCPLFDRLVIGLFVLFIHFSPVALDVAVKGLLDELGEVRVLARQVVNPSADDNLAGLENRIDYEQCIYGYHLLVWA